MKDYINTIFTIRELKEQANAESLRKYDKMIQALSILEEEVETIITNGRVNHYWFQAIIGILSNGELTRGGQGNSQPDLFWGSKRLELKGFTTAEMDKLAPIRTGASKFFAGNSGITALKESDKKLETLKQIVFDSSYHDDYYMLTETCGLDSLSKLEDVRIIFVETSVLVDNLITSCGPHTGSKSNTAPTYHHSWADTSGKKRKKKINWPYLEVDTARLCKVLEVLNDK